MSHVFGKKELEVRGTAEGRSSYVRYSKHLSVLSISALHEGKAGERGRQSNLISDGLRLSLLFSCYIFSSFIGRSGRAGVAGEVYYLCSAT